ncbi:MAG: LON peptidase substrate-binding domain-containing protein, partial [Endomicrobiales bacterium]
MPENELDIERMSVPEELSILPLRGIVVFPSMVLPITVGRPSSFKLIDEASLGNRIIGVAAQKDSQVQNPTLDELYKVGTAVNIIKMFKMPDNTMQLLIQGFQRIILKDFTRTEPFFKAHVKAVEVEEENDPEIQALTRNILSILEKIAQLSSHMGNELYTLALNVKSPSRIADLVASALNLTLEQEQEFLETFDVRTRLERLNVLLNKELQLSELSSKIQTDIKERIDKTQREYLLREQMRAI